ESRRSGRVATGGRGGQEISACGLTARFASFRAAAQGSGAPKPTRGAGGRREMAIWQLKLVDYDQTTTYTANLTLGHKGTGHAVGTLRNLSGPVTAQEIDLSGTVHGNEFAVGGSVQALGVTFFLTFTPYVFAFAGSVRLAVHQGNKVQELFVFSR